MWYKLYLQLYMFSEQFIGGLGHLGTHYIKKNYLCGTDENIVMCGTSCL